MSLSLTNREDIIANSYSIIDENGVVVDLLDLVQGSIDLDSPTFEGTITASMLRMANLALGAPTLATRSAGTRLAIFPSVSPTKVDFGIGVEENDLMFSVGENISTRGFKWYGGEQLT